MKAGTLALVALTLWGAGCGKNTQEKMAEKVVRKAVEKQTGSKADVSIRDESVEITTEDGEVSMKAGKAARLPDGFPKDVHIYGGATVEMAMEMPEGMSVALKTTDETIKVKEAYRNEMGKQGWSRKSSMDMGEQSVLMFTKGERVANLAIGSDPEGGTRVSITVARNE